MLAIILPIRVLILLAAALLILFFWTMSMYNGLIQLRNRFHNAFAQIDVMLQRRYDLIPNLVNTAKGYMTHESATLEAVIQARNHAYQNSKTAIKQPEDLQALAAFEQTENALTGSLSRLLALSESYPNLKADSHMAELMEELISTENKIGFARQAFNDSVMRYNTLREKFPSNLVASMFSFKPAKSLQLDNPAIQEAPTVSF